MFFQGWRLDPILQFSQFILAVGITFESAPSIASDYQKCATELAEQMP